MNQNKVNQSPQPHNIWQGAVLILIVLTIVVIALMFIAWAMPSATNTILGRRSTITTIAVTEGSSETLSPTSEADALVLTEPEDVGYGDGIIIASGVLLLILLAATFREIALYNKSNKNQAGEELAPTEEEPANE